MRICANGCSGGQDQRCGWNLYVFPSRPDMAMPPPPDLRPPPDMTTGCTISGTFYLPGTINPQDPCYFTSDGNILRGPKYGGKVGKLHG